MAATMSTILAVPIWTPWPWVSLALTLCLLGGLGVLLAGALRRSAAMIALGVVLVLMVGAVHMVSIEHAAARQQRRTATRPAAGPPAEEGATP